MTGLGKKLEKIFSAASFAEAGEFDSARELAAGERKVLLVLTGREASDVKSLKYALSIAKRTDAGLEVLTTSGSRSTGAVLELCEREAERESLDYTLVKKNGCIRKAVVSYAKNRRDFLCVVIESTEAMDIDCTREERKLAGIWDRLGCPLALVSEKLD